MRIKVPYRQVVGGSCEITAPKELVKSILKIDSDKELKKTLKESITVYQVLAERLFDCESDEKISFYFSREYDEGVELEVQTYPELLMYDLDED